MKIKLRYGELEVSLHAIKKIVYLAVSESYGPVNIESNSPLNISKFFGKEEEKIRIEETGDRSVFVEVYLDVEYGVKIPEVARNTIDNIKHKLTELAGAEEVTVNIYVIGVR
jgi:uncharacterized alkaline shock family protein YloU